MAFTDGEVLTCQELHQRLQELHQGEQITITTSGGNPLRIAGEPKRSGRPLKKQSTPRRPER